MTQVLSIVSPAYNEEQNLVSFWNALVGVLDRELSEYAWEILFVDDGSQDGTRDVLRALRGADMRVRWIGLSRNFGHQAALTAALERASGDAVITMDSDLQHPPELIPQLVSCWRSGYDLVLTVREEDPDLGWWKRFTSRAFYLFVNFASDTPVPNATADFRLLSRKALTAFLQLRESHRFMRGMVGWLGFRSCEVRYQPGKRVAGESKYTTHKMLKLALDGVTSFSVMPLRLGVYLGLAACALSFVYIAYALYVYVSEPADLEIGWASLIVTLNFLGGVILIVLGLIGEYVGRIYEQVKQRPLYLIDEEEGLG
jgi:glycosyltransferase involved in cell wall biosynthesis